MSKENIVLFVADQMRADSLHHMGCEASITPNLDALLEDGVSFENAYCQNPVCVPSRCSFLTGLYPHTTGHRTMHFLQNEDEPNILKEMKNHGYEVIWVGRNDVVPSDKSKAKYCDMFFDGMHEESIIEPQENGMAAMQGLRPKLVNDPGKLDPSDDRFYSFYLGELEKESTKNTYDWNCLRSALHYLDTRTSEKPFFLYVTISFPHPPYGCEDPWYSSIDRSKVPPRREDVENLKDKPSMLYGIRSKQHMQTWSEERWAELRATYLAMVSRFDAQFGMLVDKLKEKGYYDSSNIFVYSDHGDYTGDYGIVEKVQNCFENPISNVPLLVKLSKNYEVKPRITKALAELVDLPATFADIAGIDLSYVQFGKSLVHVVKGDEEHKKQVYCEGGRIHGEIWCMEKGHGPESPYYPRLDTQSQEGPEHTKATMARMGNYKYTKRLYELDEFYDLKKDPYELHNEINNPVYASIIQEMKMNMLDWYQETTDIVPNRKDKR